MCRPSRFLEMNVMGTTIQLCAGSVIVSAWNVFCVVLLGEDLLGIRGLGLVASGAIAVVCLALVLLPKRVFGAYVVGAMSAGLIFPLLAALLAGAYADVHSTSLVPVLQELPGALFERSAALPMLASWVGTLAGLFVGTVVRRLLAASASRAHETRS